MSVCAGNERGDTGGSAEFGAAETVVGFSLVEERGRVIYGLMRRKWIGFRERSLPVAKDGDRYNLSSQLNRNFSSGLLALLAFFGDFLLSR